MTILSRRRSWSSLPGRGDRQRRQALRHEDASRRKRFNALMIEHARDRAQRCPAEERRSADLWPRGRRNGRADRSRRCLRDRPRNHGCLRSGRGNSLLTHRSRRGLECDLLHRPSRAVAQSAPIPELEDATRVVYMPGRDLSLLALRMACRKACRPISPARSSPTPRNPSSRSSAPRSANLGMHKPTLVTEPADRRLGSANLAR